MLYPRQRPENTGGFMPRRKRGQSPPALVSMANHMSTPSCVWSRLLTLWLVLSGSCLFSAETTFSPQGGEYRVLGALLGDQVYPRVAIGRTGGFVVWQDNFTDEEGLGISAQRLDSSLSPSFGKFRVNENGAADQERPQVALLEGGGAVFVWQSGTKLDQDIHARFLTSANTFATGDVRVNTFTAGVQQDAAVAALPDGGAVVIWSSWDQDGDLQGVYGQLFSAAGQKRGGEFRINQFTQYNQREPAVSALPNGNFVVVWVSELQRGTESVDIYGRLFSAAGQALGDEFALSSTNTLCLNPTVSGRPDGGFMAAWTQKDGADRDKSWDVYVRSFDAVGAPLGNAVRLNSYTYGDQFSPQLSPTGAEHLAVWTSLGQDGSWEGVYGQFIGGDGNLLGAEFGVNTTTVSKQTQPAVAADGYGRLMVVWSGFTAGTSFDLFAQRYDAIRPVPTMAAPRVSALSSTALSVNWPELAGFNVATYEVRVNGNSTVVSVAGNGTTVTGFAPATTNSFELACVLADGRRSAWSEATLGVTWGQDGNGDGIPDDWQKLYFGKSAVDWPSPNADSDGDGANDYAEFLAGTNPLDRTSVLRSQLTAINEQVRFNWSAEPGMVYQVQVSSNLVDWVNVGSPRFAAGTVDSVPIEMTGAGGFYRVIRVR